MNGAQNSPKPRDDRVISLVEIWTLIRDEWRLLAGIIVVFTGASIALALLMTPVYRAEAIITAVDTDRTGRSASALLGQFGGLAGLAGINLGAASGASNRALGVLQSRALVEEFIQRNALLPVLYAETPEPPTLWRAVEDFMRLYSVQRDIETGLITVRVEWTDATRAADWANALVRLANELLRQHDLADAERNIVYLNEQIEHTNVVGLQQVAYNLIETEMNTLMLANARQEYAFSVIDPAVVPELRHRPRRKQLVVLGTLLGGIVGLFMIGARRFLRNVHAQEAELAAMNQAG